MERHLLLNEKMKKLAKTYLVTESEIIDTLIELKKVDGFRKLGHKGAFNYLAHLGFSRDISYNYKRVAEKSFEVPELKRAIQNEELNVSTAKRIVSVINQANSKEWIEKATTLPQQALEREIAKVNPVAFLPERTRVVTSELVENRYLASFEEEALIQRVMDLESQRQKRNVTRREVNKIMALFYLEKNDPIEKAKRAIKRQEDKKQQQESIATRPPYDTKVPKESPKDLALRRNPIPALVKHALTLRDNQSCVICGDKRWVDRHHLKEVSKGGTNELDNLQILCFFHHRQKHGFLNFRRKFTTTSSQLSFECQSQGSPSLQAPRTHKDVRLRP